MSGFRWPVVRLAVIGGDLRCGPIAMDGPISLTPKQIAERIESLRRDWHDGIASGDAGPLDFAELREAARIELGVLQRLKRCTST